MSEDGYTLVEMLVAMAIIGLAFAGLSESARVLGLLQARASTATADARLRETTQRALSGLLKDAGPFVSSGAGGFNGGPNGFSYGCGAGATCGAKIETNRSRGRLVISTAGGAQAAMDVPESVQFRYSDADGVSRAWPTQSTPPMQLRTVSLFETSGATFPLASLRLDIDEPQGCVFDLVAQTCRAAP